MVGLNPKVKKLYEQSAIKPSGMADFLRLLIVAKMFITNERVRDKVALEWRGFARIQSGLHP